MKRKVNTHGYAPSLNVVPPITSEDDMVRWLYATFQGISETRSVLPEQFPSLELGNGYGWRKLARAVIAIYGGMPSEQVGAKS